MAKGEETAVGWPRSADALRAGLDSYGVVRILSDAAGKPGEERPYQPGDEALVDAGRAEWVVGVVHTPAAGRRLDHDAEREALPMDGVEVYPPAEPTSSARRVEARYVGHVKANTDDGVGEKLASERARWAREDSGAGEKGDAALQAELGGHAARSGPVTKHSDLPSDQPAPVEVADGSDSRDRTSRSGTGTEKSEPAKSEPAKTAPTKATSGTKVDNK
jgi:hypothetical protein